MDGKKEKKSVLPAKFQSQILSKPKEFTPFSKENPLDSIKNEEKKINDGWEDDDLQIDFKEINEEQNKQKPINNEKNEENFEESREKQQKDPQKKIFSKFFDVKSYISTNSKSKDEKPVNIQANIIKNNK